MANLWSGRFSNGPDPTAFEFGASFRFDKRLFEDDVTGSLAWVEGLAGVGVFTADEAKTVSSILQDILEKGRRDPAFVAGSDVMCTPLSSVSSSSASAISASACTPVARATSKSRLICACI